MIKSRGRIGFVILVGVALIACQAASLPGLPGDDEPIGECFWSVTVEVYDDLDGDGQRDSGEPGLADVPVQSAHVNSTQPFSSERTSAEGRATVGAISRACDWKNYRVTVSALSGYEFTTPAELTFTDLEDGGTVQVGMRSLNPSPTLTDTPIPSATASTATTPGSTATPAAEASPTIEAAAFNKCDIVAPTQAEAILGPLNGPPFELEYIGPDAVGVGLCIFDGALNQASVFMLWYRTADEALQHYQQYSGGEPVIGIADQAHYAGQTLYALRRGFIVGVEMRDASPEARGQAIQMAQIAVVRAPELVIDPEH